MDEAKTIENQQQAVTPNVVKPRYPKWPTSYRGPQVSEPPPGQVRMPKRTDQVIEVGYNQEIGMPSVLSPERSNPDASQRGVLTHEELDIGREVSISQEEAGASSHKEAEKEANRS